MRDLAAFLASAALLARCATSAAPDGDRITTTSGELASA